MNAPGSASAPPPAGHEPGDHPGPVPRTGRAAGLRAGVVAEQLFGPVPGGIGRYVGALARHLPAVAAAADPDGSIRWITGRHPPERLAAAGLDPAATTTLALPGRLATRAWVNLRRPRLPGPLLAALDLVHATSAAVPPSPGRALVATVHDLGFHHHPETYPAAGRRFHERATRIVVAEAARVLVPSAATGFDLTDLYGLEPSRVVVTALGVELPEPDPAPARRLLAELGVRGPFLLAVGTLEPRKNLRRLLAAFAASAEELPDHHLVVAGPVGWGPALRPTYESVRVKLAGQVDDVTLHGLYDAADGLAYPSLYEGFGLPVVEAMAHGIPVLTSDRSSLPEVAGDAALLVDPDDEAAIAAGLVRLVGDQALRARLAVAGRRRAARYTWPATAAATWAAYRQALA
jgi:glycosyltransferase involved in cell wall biosynthesis